MEKNIAQYLIQEKLGAGGMGVVYKAEDTKLNRSVALKTLPFQISLNPEIRKRFLIEAQAAAALNHPNIATIYDTLEVNNEMYIVMEYVDGINLEEKISGKPLDIQEALDIAIHIGDGLKAAHQKGIVHRDIKSQNIMITKDGHVKVMDFGLAKLSGQTAITKMGATVGTIGYMSPEQTRGDEVDQRADIWALGVVLYEMLTGKLPFKGEYEQAVVYSILNEKPKPVTSFNSAHPKELNQIIDNALAKLPDERYSKVDELLDDLNAIKKSIETGIPVEQLKSGASTAEYISKLRTEQKISSVFNYKKIISISAASAIFFFILLFKGGDILNLIGIGSSSGYKHIAVLPFTSVDKSQDNQAFVDGLMETITNKVSQLEQFADKLWVVPASEVRGSKITSAKAAHNQFGVNLVVSGSVEKTEKGYRVNLNLVNAENLRQITSREIDDPMTSNSFIQDEAIIKVAEMLNLELKPENLKKLTEGSTTNPKAFELYLKARGKLLNYDKAENVNAAIGFFTDALKIDSSFALAYAGLGEAYLQRYADTKETTSIESAINFCNKAVKLDESLTASRIIMGRIFSARGKYKEALDEFEKVLLVDQKKSDAYKGKATVYMEMGNLKEAELTYKTAIQKKPDYWSGYSYLGAFYFKQGKYEEAAAQFQQVITLNPNNAKGYRNLGSVYGMLARYDDAINAFEKSLRIEPDYRTYQQIATVFAKKNKYKEAARAYEKILEIKDTDYRIWGFLADTYNNIPDERYKSKNANQHAIKLALEQLNINPNDAGVLSSLASYYGMLGDRLKAISTLNKIESLTPADVYVQIIVGQTYEEWLGDRKTALKWIIKAIKNGYSQTEVYSRKGLGNLVKDEEFKNFIDSLTKPK